MFNEGCHQQGDSYCNLDYLLVNLGRNEATAVRLVGIFLENYPVLSQRMRDALDSGDLIALRDALHDVRSSCVLFSGQRSVSLARNFEDAVRTVIAQGGAEEIPCEWAAMADSLSNYMRCMAEEMKVFLAERQK